MATRSAALGVRFIRRGIHTTGARRGGGTLILATEYIYVQSNTDICMYMKMMI